MKKHFKYFLVVFAIFSFSFLFGESQRAIDSLTTLISKAPEDSNKVNLIFNLGRQYGLYTSKENVTHFISALKLAKKIEFKDGIKKISVTLINYLFYKNIYDLSLSYCLEYIDYLDKEGMHEDKFKVYNVLGNLYTKLGNYEKAYRYYSLAKNYFLEHNEMIRYANVLTNINILQVETKQYDSALIYGFRALDIYKRNNSTSFMANCLLGIAEVHLKKKDFASSKTRLYESLYMYQSINEKQGLCNCYSVLGQLYSFDNRPDSALKYFDIALAYADSTKMDFIKKDCYQNIAKINYLLKNYKAAYDNNLLYKQYSDSMATDNVKGKMLEMEVKYDITKKEGQLKEQEYELLAKSKQRNYLILIVGVILIFFFISFRAYSQKKKANSIISEQKKLVDDKQKEIIDSINYASRIQKALLPSEKYIDKNINKLKP